MPAWLRALAARGAVSDRPKWSYTLTLSFAHTTWSTVGQVCCSAPLGSTACMPDTTVIGDGLPCQPLDGWFQSARLERTRKLPSLRANRTFLSNSYSSRPAAHVTVSFEHVRPQGLLRVTYRIAGIRHQITYYDRCDFINWQRCQRGILGCRQMCLKLIWICVAVSMECLFLISSSCPRIIVDTPTLANQVKVR